MFKFLPHLNYTWKWQKKQIFMYIFLKEETNY